jgi:hypothetical protein
MEAAMGSVLIISLQAAVCQHDVFLVFLCVLGMLVALLNTYEYVCDLDVVGVRDRHRLCLFWQKLVSHNGLQLHSCCSAPLPKDAQSGLMIHRACHLGKGEGKGFLLDQSRHTVAS